MTPGEFWGLRRRYLSYLNQYYDRTAQQDIELQAFRKTRKGKVPVYPHYVPFIEARREREKIFKEPEVHRSVLGNEILIELDEPEVLKNIAAGKLIMSRLEAQGVPFWLFYSGGKSLHISVFMESGGIPEELDQEMQEKNFHLPAFRNYLGWRLLGGVRKSFNVDKLKLAQGRTLIRSCGSLHQGKGYYKVYIPPEELPTSKKGFREYQTTRPPGHEGYPEELEEWGTEEWLPYLGDYLKYLERKPWKPVRVNNKKPMPCLDYYLNNPLADGRKRVLILAANRLKYSIPEEKALDKLIEWNDVLQRGHLPTTLIRSQVGYAYRYRKTLACKWSRGIQEDLGINLCANCEMIE